ncbi:MAG: 4Fe-4S dicluster domain-containing protein [Deltaproteobacteria bacterium]|nr:4Fe-4S dicluster domain-containing protein [Deltaproteobacteria bacterium]
MDFDSFVEGPLLWIVFLMFVFGLMGRAVCFALAISKGGNRQSNRETNPSMTFPRLLFPFHRGIVKMPLYATVRYIFHICLIVVPIWLGGHIVLWEESRFEWSWTSLPDVWADWMTLLLLGLAACFLIRRIAFSAVRLKSSASDYVLIIIVALPFLTGYLLAHGNLDSISIMENNMRLIHVLSGEIMLIAAVFLFCRTWLNKNKCTGCAACETNCPTETLVSREEGEIRIFSYALFQCIRCGACVNSCPEKAAELRHEFGLRTFFRPFRKEVLQSVELATCQGCGTLFSPASLLERVEQTIVDDYRGFCASCKKKRLASDFHKLAPWPEKQQERLTGT